MAISSLDTFIGASKQQLCISKTASRSTSAWHSLFDVAGNPGAGTLAAANASNGVVPTTSTAGCPTLAAFGGGNTGYLASVYYGNTSTIARYKLCDLLFKAGTYAYNSGTTTLTSQPSYSARCDANYSGTQIWVEVTTSISGTNNVTVTYTNGAGTTGRTTGANQLPGTPAAALVMLPLQAGDSSVSKIESVTCSGGVAGAYNILVLRPIWAGGHTVSNQRMAHNIASTLLPTVYPSTAFYLMINTGGSISGFPDVDFTVVNG